jgi:hypothetical protein
MTASTDEEHGLALLREASAGIVEGVERELTGWVERSVAGILDAWGRTPPDARTRAEHEAHDAGLAATARVTAELRLLLALDPAEQGVTPLEIVRSAYHEPTAVLAAVGIPPVERDEFAERVWPDDRYGLAIHGLRDLVPDDRDDELGPMQLAWGLAKTKVLRARASS